MTGPPVAPSLRDLVARLEADPDMIWMTGHVDRGGRMGTRRGRGTAVLLVLDAVAVVVFAAVGRENHAEGVDVLGVLAVAAPFLGGAAAGALAGRTWRAPLAWSAGLVTWAGAVVLGLALRAAATGRLPVSFAVVATVALGILILGWRGVARGAPAVRRRRLRRVVDRRRA